VFPIQAYVGAGLDCSRKSNEWIARLIPDISFNLTSVRCLQRLASSLRTDRSASLLVIGGGKQRRWLDQILKPFPHILCVYSDVDVRADVDYFFDAHEIPFVDGTFDGVIVSAVLEHVLSPERVVQELRRVLKTEGFVYSEVPFMQQVHEGAYDFTRYTLSGHRRLFNYFDEVEGGMVAGPGTVLAWTLENFVLAFLEGPKSRLAAKALVRLAVFWMKYFDFFLVNKQAAFDAASCTYFLGRKREQAVPDEEIIRGYRGAKTMRHV